MKLYRGKKARACGKAVCPVCHRERGYRPWHGADDGAVQNRPGDSQHDHGDSGAWADKKDGAAGRDRGGGGKLWIF